MSIYAASGGANIITAAANGTINNDDVPPPGRNISGTGSDDLIDLGTGARNTTTGSDTVSAGAGNDTVNGWAGYDQLDGGRARCTWLRF